VGFLIYCLVRFYTAEFTKLPATLDAAPSKKPNGIQTAAGGRDA